MKKKMEMLRNLHRTERVCWIVILFCIFLLFKWGIDIEYECVTNVTVNVLHTTTLVVFIVTGVFQANVIERVQRIEREVFEDEK